MKNRKIFITGGKGMLASAIESYYTSAGHAVTAPTHADLDILDRSAVADIFESLCPDIVFHTAAMHVDACENDPQSAFKVNSWASGNIAAACDRSGAVLVYISSCGYFGDEKKYYSEYDPVVLKTVYARSKFQGEMLSREACKKTFLIRPGWLFGGSIEHKKNFVYQRYQEALQKPVVQSAADKFGCPTFVDDLVETMDRIIRGGQFGLYHVTNTGGCSRAEYVKKIIECCKLKTVVYPVDSSAFPRKANVPSCELLHNWNLAYAGIPPMPPWDDAVSRYIKTMLREC